MNASVALIFNPKSGQGDPASKLALIQRSLTSDFDLKIYQKTEQVKTAELVHHALSQGVDRVIAVGGDGTISATAQALLGTGIPLGILPGGTVNGFATVLGIPADLEAACQMILTGTTRTVDVAICNGRLMTLEAAIGYEAETIANTERSAKHRWGVLAYVWTGFQQLAHLNRFTVFLESEQQTLQLNAAAVTIANAAPTKSFLAQGSAGVLLDDGLLDVTVVAPQHWMSAIAAAFALYTSGLAQTRVERPDVHCFRTRRIRVRSQPQQQVAIDGDILDRTPIEVECLPQALTVLAPANDTTT